MLTVRVYVQESCIKKKKKKRKKWYFCMILAILIVIGVLVETAAVLSFRIWASATAARN